MTKQQTDTTEQLIEEAVVLAKHKIARILQFVGYASKDGLSKNEQMMDEYSWQEYELNKLFRQQLSTIASKSGEEEVKDFARAVIEGGFVDETDFNYFLEEYIEEVYPEALSQKEQS